MKELNHQKSTVIALLILAAAGVFVVEKGANAEEEEEALSGKEGDNNIGFFPKPVFLSGKRSSDLPIRSRA